MDSPWISHQSCERVGNRWDARKLTSHRLPTLTHRLTTLRRGDMGANLPGGPTTRVFPLGNPDRPEKRVNHLTSWI